MENKTVYILGAGFAIDAGAPPQADIINKIVTYNGDNNDVNEKIKKFIKFLEESLGIPAKMHKNVQLEDIFTPLDRCLIDNTSFRQLSRLDIDEMRQIVNYLIGFIIKYEIDNNKRDREYIKNFAEYIYAQAAKRHSGKYKEFDPISIISTNWDILLDSQLHQVIGSKRTEDANVKAVVDYCCYISSFDEFDENIKPGLEVLGMGGFNIKLLKLHGSLNWLQCKRCQRLYVSFNDKISLEANNKCRHCEKNFESDSKLNDIKNMIHTLESNLIMPTFLKDFSNPQYKLIWQNAGIELSEAERIIFIGYSLPAADFEMRQLLSRMTRHDVKIEVVGYKGIDEQSMKNFNDLKKRYETFFGKSDIVFHMDGAQNYIKNFYGNINGIG